MKSIAQCCSHHRDAYTAVLEEGLQVAREARRPETINLFLAARALAQLNPATALVFQERRQHKTRGSQARSGVETLLMLPKKGTF